MAKEDVALRKQKLKPGPLERFESRRKQREAREKKKTLAESDRITVADMEFAIQMHRGNLGRAAAFLGMRRYVLERKVALYPGLQRLQESIRKEVIDEAEAKLFDQVDEGYFPAVSLVLKTLGKDRGYSERVTNEHELGPNATKTAAALIEAMRTGATLPSEPKRIETAEDAEWQVVEEDTKKN